MPGELNRRTPSIAPILSEGVFARPVEVLDGQLPGGATALFQDMACSRFAEPSRWEEWTLDTEVAAIELLRQSAEIDQLDLIGYSGVAAVSPAYQIPRSPEVA